MSKILGVHSGGRIGEVMDHGSSTLPIYALPCDGSAVSRTIYAALFAVLGTQFGVGDGSTTFNVPNGLALFKRGGGTQTVGGVVLTTSHGTTQPDQMQGHTHAIQYTNAAGAATTTFSSGNAENTGVFHGSVSGPQTDNTNGTPRAGTETRPANFGITYGIVFK